MKKNAKENELEAWQSTFAWKKSTRKYTELIFLNI